MQRCALLLLITYNNFTLGSIVRESLVLSSGADYFRLGLCSARNERHLLALCLFPLVSAFCNGGAQT
jgi:hypothetical protein